MMVLSMCSPTFKDCPQMWRLLGPIRQNEKLSSKMLILRMITELVVSKF